jgi:hypothetical protein
MSGQNRSTVWESSITASRSDASTLYNLAIILNHLNERRDLSRVRELLSEAEKHGHPRARNMLDALDSALQNPEQPE